MLYLAIIMLRIRTMEWIYTKFDTENLHHIYEESLILICIGPAYLLLYKKLNFHFIHFIRLIA
jgi:hypothetical protein